MKKSILISLALIFLTGIAAGRTFYISFYQSGVKEYAGVINLELAKLYNQNEDIREEVFGTLKTMIPQELKRGDNYFAYHVLASFVRGANAPFDLMKNEDYKDDVGDLREEALAFLMDQARKTDRPVSEREFIISQLGMIARSDILHEFDQNIDSMKTLGTLSEADNLIIMHAALVELKELARKTGKKWEGLAEEATEYLVEPLGNSSPEVQRIAFIECIRTLEKAQTKTEAVVLIWEKVIDHLTDITSPTLAKALSDRMGLLVNMKTGAIFEEQTKSARQVLTEFQVKPKTISEPLEELVELLQTEESAEDLEPVIRALQDELRKDRTVFYQVYTAVSKNVLADEITAYKLRLLNDMLLDLTHSTQSTLFYNHAAALFIQEVYKYRNSALSNIPLMMLGNLMASTDYDPLLIPVIEELEEALKADLPLWAKRRIIGLLFIQAGDSPNTKVAMRAAESLVETAKKSTHGYLRWEAGKRLNYLARFSKDDIVKAFAANWN